MNLNVQKNDSGQQNQLEITEKPKNNNFDLSQEQKMFIQKVKEGKNILVDACIGSGKTTAIQYLCNELPDSFKILYITYNRLLKLDAKSKIKNKNVTVTNYHGFAYMTLKKIGVSVGVTDLIQRFNQEKPDLDYYDVLVIDEYQDIEQELAELLEYIKSSNPTMQLIAVGDMEQKIYDKTALNVSEFIEQFLGDHIKLEFTRCFRLSADLAEKLGHIWKKKIIGVNNNCKVEEMSIQQVIDFLSEQTPQNILCIGSRTGDLSKVLNDLETNYPNRFNKKTVFASISDRDSTGATEPNQNSAIFTTFDSCKGLERKICVVFDYTESYWQNRINKPQQSYKILRNIFCVAASRGKERIIFVNSGEYMLSEKTLSNEVVENTNFDNVDIASMFDFKYKENIEECFSLLKITKLSTLNHSVIKIKNKDELIDLSPCIGIYQEAVFFNKYSIDKEIEHYFTIHKDKAFLYTDKLKKSSLENKILFYISLDTNQNRYRTQVDTPFIKEDDKNKIIQRLCSFLNCDDNVQVSCSIDFSNEKDGKILFSAIGFADVVKDNIVYELKFVSELMHEHFLQCACYVVALKLKKGILWNTRDNSLYEITIPNEAKFLDAVIKTITKNCYCKYYKPMDKLLTETPKSELKKTQKRNLNNIAIIDTETNWNNEVMSIGVVFADAETLQIVNSKYYIITPECSVGGMYSNALKLKEVNVTTITCERSKAINELLECFNELNVSSIFAYNASFDCKHLPELSELIWYDIMRLAAYRQYNSKIPETAECFSTGKLKRNYGVQPILRMLTDNDDYYETHNALYDALDELKIMQLLGHKLEKYSCAVIESKPHNTKISNNSKTRNSERTMLHKTVTPINYASNNELYTVSDIVDLLCVSRSTVYKLINNKEITATKKGNKYIITKNDLEDYIERKKRLEKKALIISILVPIGILFIIALIALIILKLSS